jgi:hypothetical protein
MYTDLPNVAHDIFSFILPWFKVEASFSIGRDIMDLRQSISTGKTLEEKVVGM